MRMITPFRLVAIFVLGAVILPAPARAQLPQTLTNADVIHLAKIGVSEQTIIAVVKEATASAFDLTTFAVTELNISHVSAPVIEAMRVRPGTAFSSPGLSSTTPRAPTLAEAAAEAAKVKHDWELSTNVGPSTGLSPTAPAPPIGAAAAESEAYWRGRVTPINRRILAGRGELVTMQKRINDLTDELNANGVLNTRRGGIETERQRLITARDDLDRKIRADVQAVADIEEEGRRVGALPGWFR